MAEFAIIFYHTSIIICIITMIRTPLLIQLVNSLLKPIHPEMPSKSFRESGPNDGVFHVQRLETLSWHELTQLQGTHQETGGREGLTLLRQI